jgi:hypothetical protein
MNQVSLNEDFLKKYLLGDIDEVMRQQLEERLLTDEQFFQEFAALEDRLEDELIDAYVGGEMSERASANFQNIFLIAPHRVEKLRLIQGLNDYVNAPASFDVTASSGLGDTAEMLDASEKRLARGWMSGLPSYLTTRASLVLTLALVSTIIVAAAFYAKSRRLEAELVALQQRSPEQNVTDELSQLRARNEELTAELQRIEAARVTNAKPTPTPPITRDDTMARASQPKSSRVFSLVLSFARSRAGGQTIPKLILPASATNLRLLLKLDDVDLGDYKTLHAAVSKRDGTPIKSSAVFKSGTANGEQHLTMTLPARRLTAGDYIVRLNGRQLDGTETLIGVYDFRLVRQ